MNEKESERTQSIEWDRVASIYDNYAQSSFDIAFFVQEATQFPGTVLELMAGTGRVSLPLIKAGVNLTCVDNSPEMLAILRQKLAQQHLSAQVYEMDVRDLALGKPFDLIIIPFHSFGELISAGDQTLVLARIYENLAEGGRFICTLHNPSQRLRSVDGQLHLVGTFPEPEPQTTLLLWSVSTFDQNRYIVEGLQFYEHYDRQGILQQKTFLPIRFALLQRADFEALARSAGFHIRFLYGDYTHAPFEDETSPYMIWILEK